MIGWSRRNVFLGVAIFVIVLILSQLSSPDEEVDGELLDLSQLSSCDEEVDGELLDALREAEVATRIKDHLGDSALVDNLLDEAEASGSSGDEILRKMLDEIEAADRDEREEIIQSILALLETVATVESVNLQVTPLRSDFLIDEAIDEANLDTAESREFCTEFRTLTAFSTGFIWEVDDLELPAVYRGLVDRNPDAATPLVRAAENLVGASEKVGTRIYGDAMADVGKLCLQIGI